MTIQVRPLFPHRRLLPAALLLAGAVLPAHAARAADGEASAAGEAAAAEDSGLGEIIVTAERREADVQTVPLSIGVLDSALLGRVGFTHLMDVDKVVAGVTFFRGAANQQASVIIRGVGTTNQGYTQAVGIYIDDVPLIRSVAAGQWDLPDIERIEVLRGPQGTLYGQNSTAGAIKIVSRDPGQAPEGWVSVGVGNYKAFESRAYVSAPIAKDLLAASLAVTHRWREGFGENPATGERISGTDLTQARIKLKLTPADGLEAVFAADGLIDRSDNGTNGTPLNLAGVRPRDKYYRVDLTSSRLLRGGLSLKVSADLSDDITLRSITGYRGYEHDPDPMDLGGLPVIGYEWDQRIRQTVFSQELQLLGEIGRLTYTLGALYIGEDWFNDNKGTQYLTASSTVARRQALTQYDTDDIGLYAQLDYDLTDKLRLSAGARYYRTSQRYTASAYTLDADYNQVAQIFSVSNLKKVSDGITPRLSLNYQWTPDIFSYASYTQGAKFGGFNRSATSLVTASVAADPETVSAYEIGLKTRGLDGRLQVNVSAFYNDFRDYLAVVANPTINGQFIIGSVLANAAKAHTYGGELEIRTRPVSALSLDFSFSYLKTRFDEFLNPSGAAAGDYEGNRLPFAPEFTAAVLASYAIPLGERSELNLNASYQYTSNQFVDHTSNPLTLIPERHLVDAGIEYREIDGPWSANIRVRNLFDKDYAVLKTSIPAYGVYSAAFNEPRTILATVRYSFGGNGR